MTKRIKGTCRIIVDKKEFPSEKSYNQYTKSVARSMIANEMLHCNEVPNIIYHYTRRQNAQSILDSSLKRGVDGGVFVANNLQSCKDYVKNRIVPAEYLQTIHGRLIENKDEVSDYVVISGTPSESRKAKWYKYKDGSSLDVLFYHGDLYLEDMKVIEID